MTTLALVSGLAILGGLVAAFLFWSVRDVGWRETLTAVGFSVGMTALIMAGVSLVIFGIYGEFR